MRHVQKLDQPVAGAGAVRLDARIWLLALGTFALGTDAFAIAGILPSLTSDLHATLSSGAQIVAAYALTYALGAPVLAVLTHRLPRRLVLVGSLLAFTLANLICAITPGLRVLIAARVLAGASAAVFGWRQQLLSDATSISFGSCRSAAVHLQ